MNTKEVNIWNASELDSTIYNFYFNIYTKKVYTVGYSLKEFSIHRFPDSPMNRIFQYDLNGIKEKQIYETKNYIHNFSVNSTGDKILYDGDCYEKDIDEFVHKIYIVDLKNSKEEVLLKPKDKFHDENFTLVRYSQLSLDEKGFYFLGTTTSSTILGQLPGTRPTMSNAIYYYEFSTNNISKIFEKPNVIINRFKI